MIKKIMEGKCPKDDRKDMPIFIIINNKRTLAITDGKGDAYKMYGDDYMQLNSKCLPENKYDPKDYEFERWLNGFDF